MHTFVKSHPASMPNHWQKQESVITDDKLIDAYLMGKEVGRNEIADILKQQFQKNIDQATKISEMVLNEAKKTLKIQLQGIRLRIDSIGKFSVLFLAKEADFVSDEFRKVFTLARKIKTNAESDNFSISFSFMVKTAHLNEKNILADGYTLRYGKK